MGRLTLNVLLSFAQFEREVTSERIRDKIAASKRKGLWVGGVVPLGYKAKDRKITIVESEARTVRHIFRRYLELGSLNAVLEDLKKTGITTKRRPLSTGKVIGDIPFGRGSLAHLLRNRFYIGEVKYKNEILPGEQKPILDRKLFDAVQTKLDQQRQATATDRSNSEALLMGRIFDDRGNRMTPTSKLKKGVRYRYYISTALIQGESRKAGSMARVPALLVEKLVIDAVRKRLKQAELSPASIVRDHIVHVEVGLKTLKVQLSKKAGQLTTKGKSLRAELAILTVPWSKPSSKVAREIIPPAKSSRHMDKRPIRSETRAKLVQAIAQGKCWVAELISGSITSTQQIAAREQCSLRQVNLTISLAFLSPTLVKAAVDGRLPRGVGISTVRDLPELWAAQHRSLGLQT
jgi:hypothetical protein